MPPRRLTGEAAKLIRSLDTDDPQALASAVARYNKLKGKRPMIAAEILGQIPLRGLLEISETGRLLVAAATEQRTQAAPTSEQATPRSPADYAQMISSSQNQPAMSIDKGQTALIVHHGRPLEAKAVPGLWGKSTKPQERIGIILRSPAIRWAVVSTMTHGGDFGDTLAAADTHANNLMDGLFSEKSTDKISSWQRYDADLPEPVYTLSFLSSEGQDEIPVLSKHWLGARATESNVAIVDAASGTNPPRPVPYQRSVSLHVETVFGIEPEEADLLSDGVDFRDKPIRLGDLATELVEEYTSDGIAKGSSDIIIPAFTRFILAQSFRPQSEAA